MINVCLSNNVINQNKCNNTFPLYALWMKIHWILFTFIEWITYNNIIYDEILSLYNTKEFVHLELNIIQCPSNIIKIQEVVQEI